MRASAATAALRTFLSHFLDREVDDMRRRQRGRNEALE